MNKTININLAGIIFHLDEVAFEKFKNYLSNVKTALGKEESGEEIIADIEARIAEIFNLRMKENSSQVVELSDIEFIIETLGQPEAFVDESENEEPMSSSKKTRRFFRNPDEKLIGGVCSGIGAYFDIDPVWIRVLFLVLLFFTGIGFITYVILWAAIPEAKTTAQKLQMRGEAVNLNNIEKLFTKVEDYTSTEKIKSGVNSFVSFVVNGIGSIFSFVFKFIGVMLAIVGALIAFTLIVTLLGVFGSTWNLDGFNFISLNGYIYGLDGAQAIFGSGWRLLALRVGTLLTLLLPLFALVVFLAKIFGRELTNSKLLSFSGIASFIVGLILIFISAGSLITDFRERSTETDKITLSGMSFEITADILEDDQGFFFDVEDELLHIENVRFNIEATTSPTASLELKHAASGRNHSEARQRAQSFDYPTAQVGEELRLSEYFTVPKESLYRGQDLKVTLRLPIGATVYLDESIENIMYHIRNVQDMYDGDMLGHLWEMTPEGLSCTDCTTIEYYDAKEIEESIEDNLDEMEESIERKLEELELELKKLKDR
ncbi:MAG: PspC domain-containing protein [Schleiferiaceae bacterium]|nr:PspC domain-containing protein [Schleiferiaceae bacterium]